MHRLLVCLSAAAALTVPATAGAKSAQPAPIPASGVAPAAKGGGGKFTASLPADLPSDATLPTGKLTGSTGSSPNWSIGLLMTGGYADVMTSVHDLYIAHGYSDVGPSWMYRLTNGVYDVMVVGRNHDHGATQTDITVQVTKRLPVG